MTAQIMHPSIPTMQPIHQPIENSAEILFRIRALVVDDIAAIDAKMQAELTSSVPLACEITQHIFKSKGKQLRPLLLILVARAFATKSALSEAHHELAVVIEFVHTATLLHDDVVDRSELRRGQKTANAVWGNAASVLVGDFLYSRAFQILARHQHPRIMQTLSETTNAIAEGEIMQLMHQRNINVSEQNYFHVITQKTARLFSAAAEIGAILSHADAKNQKAMADYGLHLGIVFQLIDDLLDYETSSDITGKNIGDDLAEGKVTLPLIYALEQTTPEKAALIRNTIQNGDKNALPMMLAILKETDAFSATRKKAKQSAALALQALQTMPASQYHRALQALVEFAVERAY